MSLYEKCDFAIGEERMFSGKPNSSFITYKHIELSCPNLSFHILFLEPQQQSCKWFSTSALTPSKLFTHIIHIGSYQPPPLLKTNHVPRLKIPQWFSFVSYHGFQGPAQPSASCHPPHASPTPKSSLPHLPSGPQRRKVPPTHTQILKPAVQQFILLLLTLLSFDINSIFISSGKLSHGCNLFLFL